MYENKEGFCKDVYGILNIFVKGLSKKDIINMQA